MQNAELTSARRYIRRRLAQFALCILHSSFGIAVPYRHGSQSHRPLLVCDAACGVAGEPLGDVLATAAGGPGCAVRANSVALTCLTWTTDEPPAVWPCRRASTVDCC